ncbi:MAG: hypothetical protein EXS08_11930 [Planctomycetes bacterium]|nr:hypothetical protein [Planctomycetota bacterium]
MATIIGMGQPSNRERIARAAEEARLAAAEKAVKKEAKAAVKSPAKASSKRVPKVVRMKIIWEVCNGNGKVLQTFTYPEKEAAQAATQALIRSTGSTHVLRPTKVPME